jgi:hypothetical protein
MRIKGVHQDAYHEGDVVIGGIGRHTCDDSGSLLHRDVEHGERVDRLVRGEGRVKRQAKQVTSLDPDDSVVHSMSVCLCADQVAVDGYVV